MSDSRRKRMLRAEIPAELERRGMQCDSCKIVRETQWRTDPLAGQYDYIEPDDLLAYRKWFLHAGAWPPVETIKGNGAFYSQPRGWKRVIDCIGQVP